MFVAMNRAAAPTLCLPGSRRACSHRGGALSIASRPLGSSSSKGPSIAAAERRSKGQQLQQCSASGGGGGGSDLDGESDSLTIFKLVSSPLYRVWLQSAVVLFILMAIDAAYSGDWSRIGVLTHEQEAKLQQALTALGFFHIACGTVAAVVSRRRSEAWVPRTAKVLAVGFLALVEVLVLPGRAARA
ncbi:hypothetical protein D9Q98_009788 [Chlorella vulgaris]|uniref:DUF7887 domain-containing protein n=1 Tax=Chlorella vulgaris TaxID=3077 RepID=A0A9D4TEY7_CHLVU|nr:hypothetical protein D9Q98_009788 [Chlorella vulgaris]